MSDDINQDNSVGKERVRLLAPHLAEFDTWYQFAESVDAVMQQIGINLAVDQLKWLRSPLNLRDVVIGNNGTLVNAQSVPAQDRDTLVLTADLLGFRYYDTNLLTADNYLRLCQNLAEYYRTDKGTERWQDFLGFCLDAEFNSITTWTKDYVTFLEEGDPLIGSSVEAGGPWYPTTHVIVQYDQNKFAGVPPKKMVEFFTYFANINIVIYLTELVSTEKLGINAAVTGLVEVELPFEP